MAVYPKNNLYVPLVVDGQVMDKSEFVLSLGPYQAVEILSTEVFSGTYNT